MQRWEYKVVSLRDRQYTAALNEFGAEGWELVDVVTEELEPAAPERRRGIPMPRAIGRLEEAADKIGKIGADQSAEAASSATSRLLWVFRRPVVEE
jgi:hypothetical protein